MAVKFPVEVGHTCKNQFVILDCRGMTPPTDEKLSELAEKLCNTPVADDLLILLSSDKADVHLRIFGGDRREAEFCGNGMVYTAAKIGAELHRDNITIESASGIKAASKLGDQWKVEIGPAIIMDDTLAAARQEPLQNVTVYSLVKAGEPHLVVFSPNELEGFHSPVKAFEGFCRPLCDITDIPGGVSITTVFEIKSRSVLIRTFERGARRHSFSCGTGSVSAIVAVFGTPEKNSEFHVCAPGGSHTVIFENNRWFLVATPQRIGTGHLDDDVICLPLNNLFPYAVH